MVYIFYGFYFSVYASSLIFRHLEKGIGDLSSISNQHRCVPLIINTFSEIMHSIFYTPPAENDITIEID